MGLFDGLKKRAANYVAVDQYFKLLNAYAPSYTTYQGGLYEMALTRASIHAFATHCAKLKPVVNGSARADLERILQYKPNEIMDTYSFLYKLASILKVENTAFIIPLYDQTMRLNGFWPARSSSTEIKVVGGVQYLIYENPVNTGSKLAIEMSRVGVLRNHYYSNSLYGNGNSALDSTLNLMYTSDQGIINGVKNSANIRFIARLANIIKPDDLAAEKTRFSNENLSAENNGGVMFIDNRYADVKPIESKQLLVDPDQVKTIQNNVYNYLGVNEKILQNSFTEEEWNAYYEGSIEPFAIQLSLVMTNMVFSEREKANNNSIMFESNRLQYASNTTKIALVTQLFDRGFITQNQGLEIFNMPPVENGDNRWIRREYAEITSVSADEVKLDDSPSDMDNDMDDADDSNDEQMDGESDDNARS